MASLSLAEAIDEAVVRIREAKSNGTKAWFNAIDVDAVADYMLWTLWGQTPHYATLVDNVLVLYCIGAPWWSEELLLQEDLIIRVGPEVPGDFDRVIAHLELTARAHGCKGLGVGTAFSSRDPALVRAYQARGFKIESHNLYKEL